MTRFPRRWAPLAAVLWAAGPGVGTATADDVQVNTYTTSFQAFPAVAADADGDFVIVWHSVGSPSDPSGTSVKARRFTSDGSALGGELQVNTYTTNGQGVASVASDPDGDFVVVWGSQGSSGTDSSGYSVQGQRYASDGSAVGGQFQVNSSTSDDQRLVDVASDPDSDFVVVWHSQSSAGTDADYSVQGQRYASDGTTVGGEFQVNTYTTGAQVIPGISMDADGDFVVVWMSYGSPDTDFWGFSIQGQRYASDGSAVGGQFQINSYTTGDQEAPSVSLDPDGDFVVVWATPGSNGTDSSGFSVQSQRYASDGAPMGGELQVNSFTTADQRYASVASDADGDFVVVWASMGSSGTDSSDFSIQGRRYASNGSALGDQFQINTHTPDVQSNPRAAVDATGELVVVWHSLSSAGTDSSYHSIQRTDYAMFADGFEAGNTSAWSGVSP